VQRPDIQRIPRDVVRRRDAVVEIRPVVPDQRGRTPRLLAAADPAERERGREESLARRLQTGMYPNSPPNEPRST